MTGMIPGLPQFNAIQNPNNGKSNQTTQQAITDVTNIFQTFADDKAGGIASKLAKQGAKETQQTSTQTTIQPTTPEEVLAQLAGVLTEDEIKTKKKRKKSTLEKNLEQLEDLEGNVDQAQLNDEEKGIMGSFFENMNRIKNLRGRLKRLREEEDKAKKKLKEQKEREKRRQQLKQKKQKDDKNR